MRVRRLAVNLPAIASKTDWGVSPFHGNGETPYLSGLAGAVPLTLLLGSL